MVHDGLRVIAEEEIHDLVDGRCDPRECADLARRLRLDSAAVARLRAYRALNAGLAALYGPVAAQPVPPGLVAAIARVRAATTGAA